MDSATFNGEREGEIAHLALELVNLRLSRQPGASRNCSLGRVGGTGGYSTKELKCTKENGRSK